MSVERGSTVHDSTEPVPLYHQTKLKKYKNEEEDRGAAVLETLPLSFIFLVSDTFPPNLPPLPTGQWKLCIRYPCKGFLLMAQP